MLPLSSAPAIFFPATSLILLKINAIAIAANAIHAKTIVEFRLSSIFFILFIKLNSTHGLKFIHFLDKILGKKIQNSG